MTTSQSLSHNAFFKILVTGFIAFALLIPLFMVGALVSERAQRRNEVTSEVSAMWGKRQTVGALVLTVPFDELRQAANGVETVTRDAHVLPETLVVDAEVTPEIRSRSIFDVIVYRAKIRVSGRFVPPDFTRLGTSPSAVHWDRATVSYGISDVRGLSEVPPMTFGDASLALEPGAQNPLMSAGLQAVVPGAVVEAAAHDDRRQGIPFTLQVTLAGTDAIAFLPTGATTDVTVRSPWPDPGFAGAFLPVNRQVSSSGVTAHWQVTHFARGYPQAWVAGAIDKGEHLRSVGASEFSLDLVQAVDGYRQTDRAVKYGALFILLTFVVFFLWEVLTGLHLHPVQYVLVGSALVVFYLLLVSLSERLAFATAYLVAAAATTVLVSGYASAILRAGVRGATVVGGWLAMLYSVLYVLLRLEDLALLVGAVLVFLSLAAVMWLTRRIDWYEGATVGATTTR